MSPQEQEESLIPFAIPDITDLEKKLVMESLESGWLTTGPKTAAFEQAVLDFLNSFPVPSERPNTLPLQALAVNSATSGLHLALEAVGIGPGDRVIVPSLTFTASAEVVRYLGAEPLFCDVGAKDLLIDVQEVKKLLETDEDRTIKAIMPVHYGGQACELNQLCALAKTYGIAVIEDAAHAFGTTYRGAPIGKAGGDIVVFSFYANKNICCGEGGMIVTSNSKLAKRMKVMRLHGIDRDVWQRFNSKTPQWYYEIVAPGYKYNLPDMAAALGLAQLQRHAEMLGKRIEQAAYYRKRFSKYVNMIEIPTVNRPEDTHSYHLFPIIFKHPVRNEFIEWMSSKKINCSVHYIPLHQQPYWKERYHLSDHQFPISTYLGKQLVSLPIYSKLSSQQIECIADRVIQFIEQQSTQSNQSKINLRV